MSTATYVDDVDLLGLQDLPDEVDYGKEYEGSQGFKPLPPPGAYFLRLPSKIQFGKTPQGQLTFVLNGTKIEDATKPDADGYELRYFDVTKRLTLDKLSTGLDDVAANFGLSFQSRTTKEWAEVARQIEGQLTNHPVYLTWNGYDKAAVGKAKYLKYKDFPVVDGVKQTFVIRKNDDGSERKIYANLRATDRGWAPPKQG